MRSKDAADIIERLAELAGVAASYRDAWGRERPVPRATRQSLLAAMGFDTRDRETAAASLQRLEYRPWRRALPPAIVLREDDNEPCCDLVLENAHLTRQLYWSVVTEQGETLEGEVNASALPVRRRRSVDRNELVRLALPLPDQLPCGYHRLRLRGGGLAEATETSLIVAPARAHVSDDLEDGRLWGIAVQLYGLRSPRNWGIGDFADLRLLAEKAGRHGADAIALNPLHALFPDNPAHISPYGPSSREFLNTAYISPPDTTAAERADGAGQRQPALVDYPSVLPRKRRALEQRFRAHDPDDQDYRRFLAEHGRALQDLAVFQALSEHFGPGICWYDWPRGFRDPESAEVAAFARQHSERVDFFLYLQWLADRQLGEAARACADAGMAVGLCRDLAVGTDRWGAETWRHQALFATQASIGAPPDAFNLLGQNWGIPPVNPLLLRERAYQPFITLLRANMRHAGALRVDHVLGWMRQYWVPEGVPADRGGYVAYPFDELLAIAALESRRNRCAIIGEDLGTVPDGLRAALDRAGVLSTRVLYFERDEQGDYSPPAAYPRLAAASVTTHDLPTLRGFVSGHDLALRARYSLFPSAGQQCRSLRERAAERRALTHALQQNGLLPDGHLSGGWLRDHTVELALAAYQFLARSHAGLVMVYFEDILELFEQVNLPGTVDEHPNWQRKLPLDVDQLFEDRRVQRLVSLLNGERPRRHFDTDSSPGDGRRS